MPESVEMAKLRMNLDTAKEIISSFVWPEDMDEAERRNHLVAAAKFAGCRIPEIGEPRQAGRKGIRLFVDDLRSPPEEGWEVARTSREAIARLANDAVVELSLDHDLGGDDTGYRVICWLEEHVDRWPADGIACHSMNPVGRQRIMAAIARIQDRMFQQAGHA